jgi:hypothetical protein
MDIVAHVIEAAGSLDWHSIEKTILSAIDNEHTLRSVYMIPVNETLTKVYGFEDHVV